MKTPPIADEQALSELLDRVSEAFITLDREWQFTYLNERAESLFGRPADELLGAVLWDAYPALERTQFHEECHRAMESRDPVTFRTTFEPSERHLAVHAFPSELGLLVYLEDVTDRRLREDRLVGLRTVLDGITDAVWVIGDDERLLFVNETVADVIGSDRDEIAGVDFRERLNQFVPAREFETYSMHVSEILAGERESWFHECTIPIQDRTVIVDLQTTPFDLGPDRRGVVTVARDVTDRRDRENRLELTNEQLRILNRITRHDIRNDMNVVLGWSQELETHVDDDGLAILDRIQSTCQHVVDLTVTVRDFVDALGSDARPAREPIDLAAVLEEELLTRRETYPNADFLVRTEIPHVPVLADDLLSSVFRNLLNNAAQHNDAAHPTVEVSVDVAPETVTVAIADNGPGIPDERKERVFGRSDMGAGEPSSGIGLYLVDTLVDSYDGRVWVADNEPRGSVFSVDLPLAIPGDAGPHGGERADD